MNRTGVTWAEYNDKVKRIKELESVLKEAFEVIDFYGDEDLYDWSNFIDQKEKILIDNGKKARSFLEKNKDALSEVQE